jgi:hypothetical protein
MKPEENEQNLTELKYSMGFELCLEKSQKYRRKSILIFECEICENL